VAAVKEATGRERLAEVKEATGRKRAAAARENGDRKPASENLRTVKKKRNGWDPVRVSLICLAAVAVTAYIVVAVYYGRHFYSGSQIYGIDCSKKTSVQVKQEVMDKIGEYTLTVEERDGKKDVITAAQISLQYQDDKGIEQQLKKQRCYIWPAMLLLGSSGSLAINTTYDREGIDRVLEQMNCFLPGNIVAPQDAYRGDTEEGYEVVPEVMGTTLNYDKTKAAILEALDQGLTTVSLDEAGCYIDPLVYQNDPELNAEVEELNSLLTARITYDFSDRQEVVDASVIKEWICKDENGDYYIDDNHVWAYVADLAAKYDTFGGARTFYTSFGTAVELYGGDYGWAMDQDATAQILADDVKAGKTETIQPQYVYTAMDRGENDIGGTYVEVCISRQEMWCYQDGVLIVDTPVVTGNPNKDNATPSGGVWAIDAKMQDYVLRGEGYESPVDYWMPFNGDVGIHDMQNRYYFGGSIYLTNGSHGCVNTPYDAAQTIYNIVSIGTPVVVYE
ncbi:MAG: L,D-transpeptidase family protein, partial [Lachnospiraceae bacterium]|nr:L,D-transpeptidase family protein [Lachnospiraceae bacterium]